MAVLVPKNRGASQLAAGISASDNSLTVPTGEGAKFNAPTGGDLGYLVIKRLSDGKREILTFSGRTTDSLTGLSRAVEAIGLDGGGSDQTAYAFVTGDQVAEILTHASIASLVAVAPYLRFHDSKAAGTDGGTFTAGSWQKRTLTAKTDDTAGIGSLASSQITLPAGTYRCLILCPCYAVNQNQARLRDVTNNVTLVVGKVMQAQASGVDAIISGLFTLAGTAVLEIQHQCQATVAGAGFGVGFNFGEVNIYTVAEFWKLG
jgi:hypothetical protein